jgi:hypothetical protein
MASIAYTVNSCIELGWNSEMARTKMINTAYRQLSGNEESYRYTGMWNGASMWVLTAVMWAIAVGENGMSMGSDSMRCMAFHVTIHDGMSRQAMAHRLLSVHVLTSRKASVFGVVVDGRMCGAGGIHLPGSPTQMWVILADGHARDMATRYTNGCIAVRELKNGSI